MEYFNSFNAVCSCSTRPSALGMSDPVIESQEIKETQEFPSIQNVEGGEEDERGEGSEGDDEKR